MALTGNTVQSTYLDLVQLEKSGAGLPSHAGKEAALYDGSGAQIVGRTAQRHWLDPHPDAASFDETWEFSTTGDMTQGQLESAGWTFKDCSGSVSNGIFWLSGVTGGAAANWAHASLSVSLSGDFDLLISPLLPIGYADNQGPIENVQYGGVGVAIVSGNDAHHVYGRFVNGYGFNYRYTAGAWDVGGGSETNGISYAPPSMIRISRVSGTVYLYGAVGEGASPVMVPDDTAPQNNGWTTAATVSDSQTFDKIFLAPGRRVSSAVSGQTCGFRFLRRFQ